MPTPQEILRERARKARIPIGQTDNVQPAVSASEQTQPVQSADLATQYMQLGQQTANTINNAYADLAKANADAVAEQQRVNQQREQSFAQMMIEQRDAYKQRMAENEIDEARAAKAARYTGATELAASLINLAGVAGIGSENQVYKGHSVDWMQKMDKQKETNRAYKDTMRDKMNSLQAQLDALRQGNLTSVLNLKLNGAKEEAQGRIAAADQAQKTAQGALELAHRAEREAVEDDFKDRQLRNQAWATKVSADARAADDARQAAALGLVPDGKGGYTYNADLDPKIKQAKEREAAKVAAKQTKAGYGGSANNLLKLSIDDGHGGGETYVIEPKSLAATIYANSPSVTDKKSVRKNMSSKVDDDLNIPGVTLTKEEQRTLLQVGNGTLKGAEATIALAPILKNHPELHEAVKHSSESYSQWAYANGYQVPDYTSSPAPTGNEVKADSADEPVAKPQGGIKFPDDEEDEKKKKNNGIVMP